MGRQIEEIISSLTGGTVSINANLTDIEALLTTLQADIVDGIIVSSGTVQSNLRDGSGNLITSTTSGTKRLLDVSANVSLSSALDANIRDGAGNLLTSSSRGSERALSVQIVDASGNQITSFGTANVSVTNGTIAQITSGTINSNLRDGSGNSITSTSISGKQRLDVTLAGGGTVGSASPTFADLVAGTDGTNLRALKTDSSGRVSTQIFDSSGTALTYAGTGTAGTPSSDVVSIQGITGATPVIVSQSTATSLRTQAEAYQGGTSVSTSNPLQVSLANTGANTTSLQVRPRNASVAVTSGTTSGTANTSAQALASSSTRQYLLIQNISDTDMYFNFGATATTSNMLITKTGGGVVFETGFVPTDAVNVICSAASKSYYILSA